MKTFFREDRMIRVPVCELSDEERRALDREFLRGVYERATENKDLVVRWRHRSTDGLQEALNNLRFQAGHSTGTESGCLDMLKKIAAIAVCNARAMQILVDERSGPNNQPHRSGGASTGEDHGK